MFNSAAKAFGRGLSYHAGAGVGEAFRGLTTIGASAILVLGIQHVSERYNHTKLQNNLNDLLKNPK